MDEQKQQELIYKFGLYEQQIRQIQEQLQAVEQAIGDSTSISDGLNDLKDSKGKEIFASVGKGIFVKAKVDSEDLLVDVGSKNFVRKKIPETQNIIKEQMKKLEEAKNILEKNLDEINSELTTLVSEVQGD